MGIDPLDPTKFVVDTSFDTLFRYTVFIFNFIKV